MANLVTEFAYLIRCKFANIPLFISYIVFCILKIIIPTVNFVLNLTRLALHD